MRTRIHAAPISVLIVVGLAAGLIAPLASAEIAPADARKSRKAYKKPGQVSFVRIRENDAGKPTALQVANVRYIPIDGSKLSVTLYGAVHVGDAAYYERLNKSFTEHEVLLYELANDPQVLQEREREPSILSMFQMDMGDMLGLTKQLEAIDYDRPNFVHADMPITELFQHAQEEGDDLLTVAAQTLLDVQRMVNRGEDPMAAMMGPEGGGETPTALDPMGMLGGGGDPRKMKVDLARQLVSQSNGGILEGITVLDRYLIGARNKRCLQVLDQQIARGIQDIGVFYGAGHNPDFHRRLMADYGLMPAKVTWVDAWDLEAEVAPRQNLAREMTEEELLMELMRRLMEYDQ